MEHDILPQYDQQYRRWYTHEASHYDRARFAGPEGRAFDREQQRYIRQLLGVQPGQTVLDLAAGTGRIAFDLALHQIDVTALDLTRAMLSQAQARAAAAGVDQIKFVEGNGRQLPFADERFDAVIAIRFFHLLPTTQHAPFVSEMWRVLRPGGVLLIEYNSAIAGGGLVWLREAYRRVWRGNKPRRYIWPHQLDQVVPSGGTATIHGFSPFGHRLLRPVAPPLARAIDRRIMSGPASMLANRVFLRIHKPADLIG